MNALPSFFFWMTAGFVTTRLTTFAFGSSGTARKSGFGVWLVLLLGYCDAFSMVTFLETEI